MKLKLKVRGMVIGFVFVVQGYKWNLLGYIMIEEGVFHDRPYLMSRGRGLGFV
jgi:hypothetical protein